MPQRLLCVALRLRPLGLKLGQQPPEALRLRQLVRRRTRVVGDRRGIELRHQSQGADAILTRLPTFDGPTTVILSNKGRKFTYWLVHVQP